MRSVASPTMLHDFSRWLWPRSQLRAPAAIYQRRSERSNGAAAFEKRAWLDKLNKPVFVAATYETRARNSANRTEIRTDTESKASFDK